MVRAFYRNYFLQLPQQILNLQNAGKSSMPSGAILGRTVQLYRYTKSIKLKVTFACLKDRTFKEA